MGKIDMFAINFDKPNPYYFGGETLSGRVIIRCRERMKINDVHIDIISCSDVHWFNRLKNLKRLYFIFVYLLYLILEYKDRNTFKE